MADTNAAKVKNSCPAAGENGCPIPTPPAPDDIQSSSGVPSRVRFGLASVLHVTGRMADRLISAYDNLFSLDNLDTAKIYMGMGRHFAHDGNSEGALAALNKTVEMHPDNAGAWFQLGLIRLGRHETESAAEALEKAKKLGNKSFELYSHLAEAYNDLGNYKAVARELKLAVKADPQSAESFFQLGMAFDNLKNYDEAAKALQKAIDISPREATYYQSLGFTLESLKQHDKAITCFKRAVDLERRRNQ